MLIPLPCELKVLSTAKRQDTCFIPLSRRRRHTCFAYVSIPAFSFAKAGAKEKAIKKKTPKKDFALCGALTLSRRRRHTCFAYVSIPDAADGSCRLLKKAGENFNLACESFYVAAKTLERSKKIPTQQKKRPPEGGLFRYSVIQEYYYLEKEGTIT